MDRTISNQLIGHIMISEMPVIFIASILGSILGIFGTNPAIAVMLAQNGIVKCNFIIDLKFVVLTPVGISFLGLLTILAISHGIKKISPCKMFEEGKN